MHNFVFEGRCYLVPTSNVHFPASSARAGTSFMSLRTRENCIKRNYPAKEERGQSQKLPIPIIAYHKIGSLLRSPFRQDQIRHEFHSKLWGLHPPVRYRYSTTGGSE